MASARERPPVVSALLKTTAKVNKDTPSLLLIWQLQVWIGHLLKQRKPECMLTDRHASECCRSRASFWDVHLPSLKPSSAIHAHIYNTGGKFSLLQLANEELGKRRVKGNVLMWTFLKAFIQTQQPWRTVHYAHYAVCGYKHCQHRLFKTFWFSLQIPHVWRGIKYLKRYSCLCNKIQYLNLHHKTNEKWMQQ